MQIPESELIINKDGSVYHLNLKPEDVADTIITVGDQNRVAQVSKYFDEIEVRKHKREFLCHTGILNKRRLTVISSGIGTDNIDIVINEIDALHNISLDTRTIKETLTPLKFYRLGTSGSIQKDIEVGSMVASLTGIGADNLNNFYTIPPDALDSEFDGWLQNEFDSRMNFYSVKGSNKLAQSFFKSDLFVKGHTFSAIGFYGPQGRKLRNRLVNESFTERLSMIGNAAKRITNIEMETSGIYLLAANLGHAALSINVILANRKTGKFSPDPPAAIDSMIEKSLEIIAD